MSAFFFQRINDHIQYLRKLEKTLKGEGDFQGSLHTDCKLGKWMHGEGDEEVRRECPDAVGLFESMFDKHQAFHEAGATALAARGDGRTDDMNKAITEMLKQSNALIDILTKLDQFGCKKI